MLSCVLSRYSRGVLGVQVSGQECVPRLEMTDKSVPKLHVADGDVYFFIQRVSIEHQPH